MLDGFAQNDSSSIIEFESKMIHPTGMCVFILYSSIITPGIFRQMAHLGLKVAVSEFP